MTNYKYLFLALVILSCSNKLKKTITPIVTSEFTSVEIKHVIEDSTLNVRALEVIKDQKVIVFLTSKGQLGIIKDEDLDFKFPLEVEKGDDKPNFRSLSARNKSGYGLSIGNPARLYALDSNPNEANIVYKEEHEKVFYDSLEFWNDMEGIAIGDPTDDCMSVIITRDGGKTWAKLSCDVLPKAKEGEAAFAASDTNIAIVGDRTWVATGGKASRVLFSPDKGKTWEVYNTPIVQGLETTGIYSIAFYDELNGFAIGGDYTNANENSANKIRTNDGGKTWQLTAENQNPGYRSCVQFVPNSNAKELVAIGFKGIDYSNDGGNTWRNLSSDGYYTLRFINDSTAYAAGNKKISKLSFK